ncbi:MAG: hypothetical protein E3J70_04425 [Candidatus Heimdallarchaeota archaeon]|nr:MAG: hypothetical protein E3J70_04425 [Candidatus Heimdallarchaeota archaeon]
MRNYAEGNGISVKVIAGSHVVLLCMNVDEDKIDGLLGFAIECEDHKRNKKYWLSGIKTFEEVLPKPVPGSLHPSNKHPIQAFIWGDYVVEPNNMYTYTIKPMYGTPTKPKLMKGVSVTVTSMQTEQGKHSIFFNRGNTASQAFSREFGDRDIEQISEEELLPWLSKGLNEALIDFIIQANSDEFALRAAVYEFNYLPVLEVFKKVSDLGADVKIIYDSRKKYPKDITVEACKKAKIKTLMKPREKGESYISHNKFIVLLKNNEPIEVWTGSTNITKSGLFGQANVGHVVRDKKIAKKYFEYWQELHKDPEVNDFVEWNYNHTPFPENLSLPKKNSIQVIFSPIKTQTESKKTIDSLDWYVKLMDKAKETVCLTAAFGISDRVAEIFKKDKPYLRYLLLDKKDDDIELIKRDKENRIAIASKLRKTPLSHLLEEKALLSRAVKYIHTKYLLIDPLSDDPIVITGSGNFSKNSARYNDENMLIIRGDTNVADIYLCDFMRLFNHYFFRQIYNSQSILAERFSYKKYIWRNRYKRYAYLRPDNSWCNQFYKKDSVRMKERVLFSSY